MSAYIHILRLITDKDVSTDNALESLLDDAIAAPVPLATSRFCCMEKCLSTEQDFVQEKPLLQLVVEEAGHMCILLPKFHCELNPIEMYWGYAKHSEFINRFVVRMNANS